MSRSVRKSDDIGDPSIPTTPTKKARRSSIPRSEPRPGRMGSRHHRNGSLSTIPASRVTRSTVGTSTAGAPPSPVPKKSKLPSWPADQIPVEIYAEIISYLPRSTVKSMRLVNREFELKSSSTFFQVVVVPFNSEIYGITPEPGLGRSQPTWEDELPQSSIMLQDKGMRVFQGFGEHIKKFAMSFEFDEVKLARPPTKDDQQAITTFWGIYPWPHTNYNRFAHLEGLEQTADETKTMARALEYIRSANELGLSLDGCLGYLNGPDINTRCATREAKPSVFGKAKYVEEPDPLGGSVMSFAAQSTQLSNTDYRLQELERMCVAAGWQGAELLSAVESLRMNDHVKVEVDQNHATNAAPREQTGPPIHVGRYQQDPNGGGLVLVNATHEIAGFTTPDANGFAFPLPASNPLVPARSHKATTLLAFNPKELTHSQREMLLEIEWAQRAFMQSYTIAIIDKRDIFQNVSTFTIARLPYRHLHIIRREDFWDALPGLRSFSLAIIPDWRDVVKEPTGHVRDVRLAPSTAVSGVYQLLLEQVVNRDNIKSIHFEWICGGEYAPGLYSRNHHILPAPIVASASSMIDRSQAQPTQVLRFPHLKKFSLRNCWMSPHILQEFLKQLQKDGIEVVKMDSVSLIAQVPNGVHPGAMTTTQAAAQHFGNAVALVVQNGGANWGVVGQVQAANVPFHLHAPPNVIAANAVQGMAQPPNPNGHIFNPAAAPFHPGQLFVGTNTAAPTVPAAQPVQAVVPPANNPTLGQGTSWLQIPRAGSWASIIDICTPGQSIADYRRTHSLEAESTPRRVDRFRRLDFTSCGYAVIPADFSQVAVQDMDLNVDLSPALHKRLKDIESVIMDPKDHLLAKIANHIDPRESLTLQNVFGLTVDWISRDQERLELRADCELDGVPRAGLGRFDGVIEAR